MVVFCVCVALSLLDVHGLTVFNILSETLGLIKL